MIDYNDLLMVILVVFFIPFSAFNIAQDTTFCDVDNKVNFHSANLDQLKIVKIALKNKETLQGVFLDAVKRPNFSLQVNCHAFEEY